MYKLQQLITPFDMTTAAALLRTQGLSLPDEVDYGVGVYIQDSLVATGFLGQGRLMGLCVDPAQRGQGLSLRVVDHLLKEALDRQCQHLFIFTKGCEAETFASMGFDLLAVAPSSVGETALLEWGRPSLADWLAKIPRPAQDASHTAGAVVLNANPFTLGHAFLLEQAAKQCHTLYAFVVEEEKSAFPFAIRLDLVRHGMAHCPHCLVLPGGPYMISRHTFPSYFTGKADKAVAHAALDAHLFATRIAPALHIRRRFVGSEPLSPVTAQYNTSLQTILPQYSMFITQWERLTLGGQCVSASRVRAHLARGEMDKALSLVPPVTAEFLLSPAGTALIQELQHAKDVPCPQPKE